MTERAAWQSKHTCTIDTDRACGACLYLDNRELSNRVADLEAALARAAAYLGVAHVLKDPKV